MRSILTSIILLLFSLAAQAQHSVSLNWVASATVGVSGYNTYRAPCNGTISGNTCSAEGTFAKIGSSTGLTYTDTTVTAGGLYVYYVTATCPAAGCSSSISGESTASAHVAAVVPKDPPVPPSGVTITTVTKNTNGANITLSATWTGAIGSSNWSFMSNGQVITQGTQNSSSGTFAVVWTGKLKPGSTIIFQACQGTNCDSRTV